MKRKEKVKNVNKLVSILLVLAVLVMAIGGCGRLPDPVEVVKGGINSYDDAIKLYQGAMRAHSTYNLCLDTQYAKIQASNVQVNQYHTAVEANTAAWTGHFKDEEMALVEAMNAAMAANPEGASPESVDLASLNEQGLLPNSTGSQFSLWVNAIKQADPPQVDPEVTLKAMDIVEEGMNSVQLCGEDWNMAVEDYNVKIKTVSGEILDAVATALGHPLPDELPYYSGAHTGPVTNPLGGN